LSEAAEWRSRFEPLIADSFASKHHEWAIIEKNSDHVIHEKVFVFDDGTQCTMQLAEEY